MSNTRTISVDGVDVDVADDPDDAGMIAVGATVSASEKVSTGDYENYEPYESVQVRFRPALDISTRDGRMALQRRIMTLHRDVQDDLEDAVDQRLSNPEFEDWGDVDPRAPDGN